MGVAGSKCGGWVWGGHRGWGRMGPAGKKFIRVPHTHCASVGLYWCVVVLFVCLLLWSHSFLVVSCTCCITAALNWGGGFVLLIKPGERFVPVVMLVSFPSHFVVFFGCFAMSYDQNMFW